MKRGAHPMGSRSQTEVSRILVCDIHRLPCEKRQKHLERIQPTEVSRNNNNRNF